jgi:hypothetical protein
VGDGHSDMVTLVTDCAFTMQGEISPSDMVGGFFRLLCDMVASLWFVIFLSGSRCVSGEESESEDEAGVMGARYKPGAGGVDGGTIRGTGGDGGWSGGSLGGNGVVLRAFGRVVLGTGGRARSRRD